MIKKLFNFCFLKPCIRKGAILEKYYGAKVMDVIFNREFGDWMILVKSKDKSRHYISRELFNYYCND